MFVGKQESAGGEQIGGHSELALQSSGLLKKIGDEHQRNLEALGDHIPRGGEAIMKN